MKEFWFHHTVEHNLNAPFLVEFNDWLEDNAEAHECIILSHKPDDNSSVTVIANFFPQIRK